MFLNHLSIRIRLLTPLQRNILCANSLGELTGLHIRHRHYSNGTGNFRIEKDKDFAVMYMKRRPANGYSLDFVKEMTANILDVEGDPAMEGLVITSDIPKLFSGGLDFKMAYQKPKEEMMEFWQAFQEAFLVLYGTRLATVAAINGHCYAAGAVSALACDSRIMVKGPYCITLNEVAIGVVIPFWIRDLLRCTVGHRQAERAMQLGTIYNAEEALRIGMVDEAVDEDKLMDSVREEMGRFLKIQGVPRAKCKQELRGKFLRNLRERREEDAHQMAEDATSDLVQNNIAAFLASRSRRE